MQKVGIIGVGKIGGSLLVRLAESGDFELSASDVHQEQLAVYEKTGVSSRGELVAKMFADHYHDGLVEAVHGAAKAPAGAAAVAA